MSGSAGGPGSRALTQVTVQLLARMALLTAPAWLFGALNQAPAMAGWWNAAVITGVAAAATIIIVAGARRSTARWPALLLAAVVLAAVGIWGLGVVDTDLSAGRLPWVWLILPLALAAVAMFDSIALSAGYAVILGGIYTLMRYSVVGGLGREAFPLIEWGLLVALGVGLALLVRAARSGALRLDADAHRTAQAGTEAAALAAAADARAEVDAVLHDKVLAALLLAVRSAGSPDVAPLARDALAALERTSAGGAELSPVSFEGMAHRIEAGVRVLAPTADIAATTGPVVPEPVARAVVEAATEAVRNSLRHGRRGQAQPVVTVRVGAPAGESDVLLVTVADDGPGFDPAEVPPERLGLAVSIHGRIRSVGGWADIGSSPGRGTTVSLRWPAPGGPS